MSHYTNWISLFGHMNELLFLIKHLLLGRLNMVTLVVLLEGPHPTTRVTFSESLIEKGNRLWSGQLLI